MSRFPRDHRQRDGVWEPLDRDTLTDYSDGADVEARLMRTLRAAADLSSDSGELRRAVVDWPTRYHLSPERGNLVRALDWRRKPRVLEIGAGCGAVTRALGERAAEVLAVEGSLTRARIARERCRDQEHVQVIAGNALDLQFEERFDVVTLIGVLEYAALYGGDGDADPFHALLTAARAHLKDDGVLLVAIENQLGLKYLAGCGEDHGLPRNAGLEGYVDGHGPRTFSRHALDRLLDAAGFAERRCLLPFPDYKLPTVFIDAAKAGAGEATRWNLHEWCRLPFEQYDGPRQHRFEDHLVLETSAAAGLLPDLSNSFLFLASPSPWGESQPLASPDWIARKLNTRRAPAFRTCVTLTDADGGRLIKRLPTRPAPAEAPFDHVPRASVEYHTSTRSLTSEMLRALRRSGQAVEAFHLCVAAWIEFLQAASPDDRPSGHVDGSLLDAIPDNLLLVDGTGLRYIDDEWRWKEPIPLAWVLYRGLRPFYDRHVVTIAAALGQAAASFEAFLADVFERNEIDLPVGRRREIAEREAEFQRRVHDDPVSPPPAPRWRDEADPVRVAHWLTDRQGVRRIRARGTAAERLARGLALAGLEVVPDETSVPDADLLLVSTDDVTPADLDPGDVPEVLWLPGNDADTPVADPDERSTHRAAPIEGAPCDERARLWRRRDFRRVTFVSPTSQLHGGTIVIWKHAELLARAGHRATIASLDPVEPDWAPRHPGLRFVAVQDDSVAFDRRLPDGDALVATLWTTAPAVARAPARAGRKLYLVQHFESLWAGEPDEVDDTYLDPRLTKLCVSSWLVEQLDEKLGVPAEPVINGSDFACTLDRPAPRAGERLKIGMLHHDAGWKGVEVGLAAFRTARAELGDRVYLEMYGVRRPTELPEGCERFLERPSREQLADWLDTVDVFVSPSICEGFGLPALEAMCRGAATVLSDSGGCRDYCDDGAVLLSPPGDHVALGRDLLRVCRDDALRERLSQRGFEVSRRFGWPRAGDDLRAAVDRAHERSASPLDILYVGAGPRWFETFMDPWLVRGLRSIGHRVHEFHPRPADFRYHEQFVDPALLDDERRRQLEAGAGRLPSELPDEIRRVRPDLVFFNKGLLIPEPVLERVADTGVPTCAWMMDEPQELAFSRTRGRLFDYVLLQDAGSLSRHRQEGNPNTFVMPHGIDPIDHASRFEVDAADGDTPCDLLVIGTGFPARREAIHELARLNANILVVGRGWDDLERLDVQVRNQPVSAAEAGRLYRSARMTLNLHRRRTDMASASDIPDPQTPNGSFFHIGACGSVQLVDRHYPGAADFLEPERDYLTFDSPQELREVVESVLADSDEVERRTRATAARCHRSHRYADRLRDALDTIGPPRAQRRFWSLTPAARRNESVFDVDSTVPRLTTVVATRHAGRLAQTLLSVAGVASLPMDLSIVHPPDIALSDWLDARNIAHVTTDAAGFAFDLATGLERSSGEWIAFLTDRAFAAPHALRRLAEALRLNPDVGLVAPAVGPLPGPQSADVRYRDLAQLQRAARDTFLGGRDHLEEIDAPAPICFAVRRAAVEAVGAPDRQLSDPRATLLDWCRRLRQGGWRVAWTRRSLVHDLAPGEDAGQLPAADVARLSARWSAAPESVKTPTLTRA